jgi:tetratricopeptide (TPR) repeat protein
MSNLAATYAEIGRHAEAVRLCEETLALEMAKYGPEHTDTLGSVGNLAYLYSYVGRHDDALALVEPIMERWKITLGPEHPDTLGMMNNVATEYANLGRYVEAVSLHEETLQLRKAKFPAGHPYTLMSMHNLAWILANTSDSQVRNLPRALELAHEALALDPKSANSWQILGRVCYRKGDWKASISALTRSVDLSVAGAEADQAFFLAMAHWQLGEREKAREWYDTAVRWMEKNQPENAELRRFRAEAAPLLGIEETSKNENDSKAAQKKSPLEGHAGE